MNNKYIQYKLVLKSPVIYVKVYVGYMKET